MVSTDVCVKIIFYLTKFNVTLCKLGPIDILSTWHWACLLATEVLATLQSVRKVFRSRWKIAIEQSFVTYDTFHGWVLSVLNCDDFDLWRFDISVAFLLPRDALPSADYDVARRPSVCPSVRPSHAGILSKRLNVSSNFSHCRVYHNILVFFHIQRYGNTPTGRPLTGPWALNAGCRAYE